MTQQDPRRPGPAVAFARSAVATLRLLAAGRLASPRTYRNRRLRFADGTTSFVFRETAIRDPNPRDPAVLVVQFRLRAFGHRQFLHALFRRECILHTPLFAGFPGFQTKLWISDTATGVYRGLYEWDGPRARGRVRRPAGAPPRPALDPRLGPLPRHPRDQEARPVRRSPARRHRSGGGSRQLVASGGTARGGTGPVEVR